MPRAPGRRGRPRAAGTPTQTGDPSPSPLLPPHTPPPTALAGNDGPYEGSVGSPAVWPWVTTVGASTQSRTYQGSVTLGNGQVFGRHGDPAEGRPEAGRALLRPFWPGPWR